jgi:hypothetical protein
MSIGCRPPDTHRRLPARNTRTCRALGPEPGKSFLFWPPVQRPGLRWILAESIALVGRASKMPRWLTGAFRTGPSSWDLVRLSATVRGIAPAGRQAASETGKIQHVNRPAAHCT